MSEAAMRPALGEADLAELIGSFNEVTRKLEGTHTRLRGEVERLTRELRQANENLERSRRLAALGEMAAGIAHEIRNPLGSIGLYARLLEQDLADRPERRTAQKIRSAVLRLDEVVSDVLAFAKEMRVNRGAADAGDLLDRAVEGCRHVLGPVRRADAQRGAVALACDDGLVVQALVNVVRNAAEAMAEGAAGTAGTSGVVTLDAQERSWEGRAYAVLSVRDEGPGVRPEVVERMFNPFFTTRSAGTGLGLAIVHRIVDAHGGRVVVRNNAEVEPGAAGATVELWLPAGAVGSRGGPRGEGDGACEVCVVSVGGAGAPRAA